MSSGMRFNTTVQQYSPLVKFDEHWSIGSRSDGDFDQFDEGFRSATQTGATLSFNFTGTGVWLYGAHDTQRANYTVVLDGVAEDFFAPHAEQYKVLLFGSFNLSNSEHTIQLIDKTIPTPTSSFSFTGPPPWVTGTGPPPWVTGGGLPPWLSQPSAAPAIAIDYIVFEAEHGSDIQKQTIEIDDSRWIIEDGWAAADDADSHDDNVLVASQDGANLSLTFEGDNIELYGTIGVDRGSFTASIDGSNSTSKLIECENGETRKGVLLYSATSLGSGTHTLRITNQGKGTSSIRVELDYAAIRGIGDPDVIQSEGSSPSASSEASETSKSPPVAAIVGGTLGGVAFFILLGFFIILKRRSRRRALLQAAEALPQDIENNGSSQAQAQSQKQLQILREAEQRREVSTLNALQVSAAPALTPEDNGRPFDRKNSQGTFTTFAAATSPSSDLNTSSPSENDATSRIGPIGIEAPITPMHHLPPPNYWQAMQDTTERTNSPRAQ